MIGLIVFAIGIIALLIALALVYAEGERNQAERERYLDACEDREGVVE